MKRSGKEHEFVGREYIIALRHHYPEFFNGPHKLSVDRELHVGIVKKWIDNFDIVGVDAATRFRSMADRS
jgi:hypothetical protein